MSQKWYVYNITPMDLGWEFLERISMDAVPLEIHQAAFDLGWEGDTQDGAFVFYVPNETQISRGYVWKQNNNGTTFVATLIPFVHLENLHKGCQNGEVPHAKAPRTRT